MTFIFVSSGSCGFTEVVWEALSWRFLWSDWMEAGTETPEDLIAQGGLLTGPNIGY